MKDPHRVKDDATFVHLSALPVSALCKTLIDLPVLPILTEKEITSFNLSLVALIDRLWAWDLITSIIPYNPSAGGRHQFVYGWHLLQYAMCVKALPVLMVWAEGLDCQLGVRPHFSTCLLSTFPTPQNSPFTPYPLYPDHLSAWTSAPMMQWKREMGCQLRLAVSDSSTCWSWLIWWRGHMDHVCLAWLAYSHWRREQMFLQLIWECFTNKRSWLPRYEINFPPKRAFTVFLAERNKKTSGWGSILGY